MYNFFKIVYTVSFFFKKSQWKKKLKTHSRNYLKLELWKNMLESKSLIWLLLGINIKCKYFIARIMKEGMSKLMVK